MPNPAPKAPRLPLLRHQGEQRAARTMERKRASARRRKNYGGSPWERFKLSILQRDGYRCLVEDEGCLHKAQTAHHIKSVGSGGKNEPENALAVCERCHAAIHDGHVPRQRLWDLLSDRYGYPQRSDG